MFAIAAAGALAIGVAPAASAHSDAASGHLRWTGAHAVRSLASSHVAAVVGVPGSAAGRHGTVLTTEVYAPFHLAVDGGHLLVADGVTSLVSRLVGGMLSTVVKGPQPGEVAGIGVGPNGSYAYTSSSYANGQTAATIVRPGVSRVHANLSNFEKTVNPDGHVHYGVHHPSRCVRKALKQAGAPVSYTGLVDSHPYAVASLGHGSWVVADAAGNDLVGVNASGRSSLLAVLPPQPVTFTKAQAASLGLPKCVVGVTYRFEPVPTGVVLANDGSLLVSTLPGGPEDPAFGANGSVYRVNPSTGSIHRVATGLAFATDVAQASDGTIYVAELGAGRIAQIKRGKVSTFASLPNALSVTIDGSHVYAGTIASTDDQGNPTGPGSIVRFNR